MDISNLDINSFATAAVGLVGAIIGAITSLIGTYFIECRREGRERRSLATSIRAELEAILHVEKDHGYRAMYQTVLDQMKRGERMPMPNISYSTDTARSVAYTNLSRIGILPEPVPAKLIRLLYVYEVVVADRQCMDAGEWDNQEASRRISMLNGHLRTYDALVALAGEVIEEVNKKKLILRSVFGDEQRECAGM